MCCDKTVLGLGFPMRSRFLTRRTTNVQSRYTSDDATEHADERAGQAPARQNRHAGVREMVQAWPSAGHRQAGLDRSRGRVTCGSDAHQSRRVEALKDWRSVALVVEPPWLGAATALEQAHARQQGLKLPKLRSHSLCAHDPGAR